MSASTTTEIRTTTRRPSLWTRMRSVSRSLRLAVLLGVAGAATVVTTALPASASSTVPGDFSSLIAHNPTAGMYVDDCYVELGIVYDPLPASTGWHHIGGVRVNCNSRHSFISATVALYYYNGTRWVQYGSSRYGVARNVYGWGHGISGILDTYAYCLNGWRGQWIVGATVSTERATQTVFSQYPAVDPAFGAC